MIDTHSCMRCGTGVGAASDSGICPACMLRSGMLVVAEPAQSTSPLKFPRVFGNYELLEELARGGMGVVYRARQRTLNRVVALKVLISGPLTSESLFRRFQTEAETAAGLQHPDIVAIHEFGEQDDQPYYTMDFVEGRNLSQLCDGRPLEARRAAVYLRTTAAAVHFAHTCGILHRDIKPSNVLIDRQDRPRVTDFGLAKRLGAECKVTLTGQMVGTPNYMACEQALGREREIDARTDVYSLGALLYHTLTGRPPFAASTIPETLRLVVEAEPVAPRILNPTVPRNLETICLKCLEKDRSRRYPTALALADDLGRFLGGEAIQARPVSAPEHGWRWCRRHPAAAISVTTVLAASIVMSVVFYRSARSVELARDAAEKDLYAANLLLIGQSISAASGGDLGAIRKLLDASRPAVDQRELRGFEWRHYWLRSRGDAIAALDGHHQIVDTAFFSPDSAHVATHSLDGTMKLWDLGAVRDPLSIDNVAFLGGFVGDGAQLVFSRPDLSIWRLDLATGRVAQVLARAGRLIAVLPDGRNAVVFGPDQLPVLQPLDDSAAVVGGGADVPADTRAVMSADGRRAAVAARGLPGIRVVDLATHRTIATLIDERPIIALALSPDGTRLVSAGFDAVFKVWDVDSAKEQRAFRAFLDPIWGMAFSPDGNFFAAAGNNREVAIWNTSRWEKETTLRGHTSTVRCVAFSPDGLKLVSGAQDQTALIWSTRMRRPPEEMPRLLRGPRWIDRTPSLAFSPDSKLFAGTAADGTIKVWRTDTMDGIAAFPMEARTVAFADGNSVVGEGFDGVVRRWTLNGQEVSRTVAPPLGFTDWQMDPLTSDGRVALIAEQGETRARLHLGEITSARDGINAGAMRTTPAIAISREGDTMFVGLPKGDVEAWDIATRQRKLTFHAHDLAVIAITVSDDGRYLATGSYDNSTQLWDAATGAHLATYRAHNRPVWALAFTPDGNTLAAGSCDKEIVLCSVPLRRHVARLPLYVGMPQGYEQEVRLLRFSPDGNTLAAALGDGTVRFFRAATLAETDEPSATH